MTADQPILVTKAGSVIDPLQLLQIVVTSGDKWVAEVQRAKVERAEVAAWEKTQTDRIRAQRDVLLKALDLTFDERRENFRRLFNGLDAALGAGNAAQVTSVLESITDLAKTSPFKDLANMEIVAAELKRPDKEWEV